MVSDNDTADSSAMEATNDDDEEEDEDSGESAVRSFVNAANLRNSRKFGKKK